MRNYCVVLLAAIGLLACAATAQVTNVPSTELETFEAQTGKVIVKATGQIGSLAVGALDITVISKESMDAGTGRKEHGMAIEVAANNQFVWKRVVDYDEMDSLLNGMDYLSKIDSKVTALPTFVASYAIQFFLQDYSTNSAKILITPAQLAQFQSLVEQAKKNLDSLQAPPGT